MNFLRKTHYTELYYSKSYKIPMLLTTTITSGIANYNWTIKRGMHSAWSAARYYGKGVARKMLNSHITTKPQGIVAAASTEQRPTSSASGERGMTMVAGKVNMEKVMEDYPLPDQDPSTWTIDQRSAVRCVQIYLETTKIKKTGVIEHASTLYKDPKGNAVTQVASQTHSAKVNNQPTVKAPQSLGQKDPNYKNSYFKLSKTRDTLCAHHFSIENDLTQTGTSQESELKTAVKFQEPPIKNNKTIDDGF